MAFNLQAIPSMLTRLSADAETVKKLHKSFKNITEALRELT